MIYRGTGIRMIFLPPPLPPPLSEGRCLSVLNLTVCHGSSLLAGEGGRGEGGAKPYDARKPGPPYIIKYSLIYNKDYYKIPRYSLEFATPLSPLRLLHRGKED
jgi:hypothetical protein